MTKQFLVVLLVAALLVAGLGSLMPAAASTVVTQVPGNTVVHDAAGDLILINGVVGDPDGHCSLPPGEPLESPPWTDIKSAKITQLGGGWVELSMVLQAPVPDEPPFPWLSYGWQFEGGCIGTQPGVVTDKDNVFIHWKEGVGWWAKWGEITSCNPRTVIQGDPVDFKITGAKVRVRVELDDLMLTVDPGVELPWHAAVRRMPFAHPYFTKTVPVDVAPDVIAWDPDQQKIIFPEDPAIWVPRGN